MRDTVFLSHANPEDNRFTLWLALRLVREGYQVWSDLTGLLGGEDFWREAELVIRQRSVKFLYVLSRVSNVKPGPLKELQIAETVARRETLNDFVIPVLIDDLPHSEINIQLTRLNAIPFNKGWIPGFAALLAKFERDAVSKSHNSSPALVTSWWREHFSGDEGLLDVAEDYLSNWFAIAALPPHVCLHELAVDPPPEEVLEYPAVWHRPYLVSFAPIADFGLDAETVRTTRLCSTAVFREQGVAGFPRRQARDIVVRLLRLAWERFVRDRGLPTYELSGGALCAYFTQEIVGTSRLPFRKVNGKTRHRQLVGHRIRPRRGAAAREVAKRYWHFGIQARPLVYPRLAYAIRTHVLFSSDGVNIWSSKDKLHRARRSACRDWWNDDWRDRILTAMTWLAAGSERITVWLSSRFSLRVFVEPLHFRSPVSYLESDEEPPVSESDEEPENEDQDEDEDEEGEVQE